MKCTHCGVITFRSTFDKSFLQYNRQENRTFRLTLCKYCIEKLVIYLLDESQMSVYNNSIERFGKKGKIWTK